MSDHPPLPAVPGHLVVAETRRLGRLRRWRLDPDDAFLLWWPRPEAPADAGRDVETLARLEEGCWLLVRRPVGEDPLAEAPFGEQGARLLAGYLVARLEAVWSRGGAHGALLPHGLELLADGEVCVLPAAIARAAAEERSPPEAAPAARDLLDLAELCSRWAVGRSAVEVAIGGAGEVSPALRATLRRWLREAREGPDPARALGTVRSSPWPGGAPAAGPAEAHAAPASAPPSPPVARTGRSRRGRTRGTGSSPLAGFAFAFLMLGAAVTLFLWPRGERGGTGERLPELAEPAGDASAQPSRDEREELARRMLDRIGESSPKEGRPKPEDSSRAVVRIDRSAIEEGDALVERAKEKLAAVNRREGDRAERRRRLEEAIELLEKARKSFERFAEQFPSRRRLVEGRLTEVNSLIFFATRQRTLR